MVGGTETSRSGAARSIAIISSTKSGLPSAASRMRARSAGSRRTSPTRSLISMSASSSESGSSRRFVAFTLPPPQPGRRSSNSGLAIQTMSKGASRARAATCSTRSRKLSSPQLTSSKTQTTDCSAAAASSSLRTLLAISSVELTGRSVPRRPRSVASTRRSGTSCSRRPWSWLMTSTTGR